MKRIRIDKQKMIKQKGDIVLSSQLVDEVSTEFKEFFTNILIDEYLKDTTSGGESA